MVHICSYPVGMFLRDIWMATVRNRMLGLFSLVPKGSLVFYKRKQKCAEDSHFQGLPSINRKGAMLMVYKKCKFMY